MGTLVPLLSANQVLSDGKVVIVMLWQWKANPSNVHVKSHEI